MGHADSSSSSEPLTSGADIDVPDHSAIADDPYMMPGAMMLTPGAEIQRDA